MVSDVYAYFLIMHGNNESNIKKGQLKIFCSSRFLSEVYHFWQ